MSKAKRRRKNDTNPEDCFYNDENYHKVDCYISNELYSMYETETPTRKMKIKNLRLELIDGDRIKIYYNWEPHYKE